MVFKTFKGLRRTVFSHVHIFEGRYRQIGSMGEILFMKTEASWKEFTEAVRKNQDRLRSQLKTHYDFIVCGSGSSGSVDRGPVGRRHSRRR
jgi:hypothetical protein